MFMLLQATLGIRIDGASREVHVDRPLLPEGVESLRVCALPVGSARIDIEFHRLGDEVAAVPFGHTETGVTVLAHLQRIAGLEVPASLELDSHSPHSRLSLTVRLRVAKALEEVNDCQCSWCQRLGVRSPDQATSLRGVGNVFTDLGFPKAEAENLMLRSELMSKIREIARGMTQVKAAKRFGITQPRLNDLLRGKIDKFSLDALVNMIAAAGLHVELRVRKVA